VIRIRRRRVHRGFSLVELLIGLGITAALMVATLVALRVCFDSYQASTEEASSQTVARLVMHRMLTMVRTGDEFGPLPDDPRQVTVYSDEVWFRDRDDRIVTVAFDERAGALTYSVDGAPARILLAGVRRTPDGTDTVPPFTLEYEQGIRLYRFHMDLTVVPDDSAVTDLDRGQVRPMRLVASAMPRARTW